MIGDHLMLFTRCRFLFQFAVIVLGVTFMGQILYILPRGRMLTQDGYQPYAGAVTVEKYHAHGTIDISVEADS